MLRFAGRAAAVGLLIWGTLAGAQPVPDLFTLSRDRKAAEAAYLALLTVPPQPSRALLDMRRELAELPSAIAANMRLYGRYQRGEITVAGPDAAPRLAQILSGLSTTIGVAQATLSRLPAQLAALEHAELVAPIDDARDRLAAAYDALDLGLAQTEAALGPMTVTGAGLFDAGGVPLVSGSWRLGADAPAELAVVRGLEAVQAALRSELAGILAQRLMLAEQLHPAGRDWSFANALLIERGVADARRDIVANWITGVIDIGLTWTSAGGWTFLRTAYSIGDTALTLRSEYLLGGEIGDRFSALEQEQVGEGIKAALLARITADTAAGRPLDIAALLDPSLALPTTPALVEATGVALVLDALTRDEVSSGISALIAFAENAGREIFLAGDIPGQALLARLFLNPARDMEWGGFLDVADQLERHEFWGAIALDEFKGLRNSLGLTAAPEVADYLTDLYRELTGPSDEQLTRLMAQTELEIFVLSEAYRQLDRRYQERLIAEPLIEEALSLARHRLALASSRSFQTAAGAALDPRDMMLVPQLTAPLTAWASVEPARVPWRMDVVLVAADGERVVGTAIGQPGPRSSTTVVLDPLQLPTMGAGRFELRITSEVPAVQDIDGNPATPAAIHPNRLSWVGREPAPDVYGFGLAGVCVEALAPDAAPGPAISTFEFGPEGWTLAGDAGPEPTFTPGEIGATDREDSAIWYWQAPAKFLGDRRSLFGSEFSYRLRRTTPLQPTFPAPDLVIVGADITLVLDTGDPVDTWTSYRHRLDQSSPWMVAGEDRLATEADIRRALGCVTAIRIRGEFASGPDTGWLSRVSFGTALPPAMPNLLVNGSFEVGTDPGSFLTLAIGSRAIEGWTVTRSTIDYVGGYFPSSHGSRHLDLDGTPGAGGITQTFPTVAGILYDVTFDMAGNPDGPPPVKRMRVEAAGAAGTFEHGAGLAWSHHTWQFRATGPMTTIEFRSLSDPPGPRYGPMLDNVSVHRTRQ